MGIYENAELAFRAKYFVSEGTRDYRIAQGVRAAERRERASRLIAADQRERPLQTRSGPCRHVRVDAGRHSTVQSDLPTRAVTHTARHKARKK